MKGIIPNTRQIKNKEDMLKRSKTQNEKALKAKTAVKNDKLLTICKDID